MTTTARPRVSFRHRLLRLAETVTTPLLPEDYLDMVAPLRAGAALRGRIVAVRAETPDAATVVIEPGRGWRGHRPGQYVRLGVDVDGVRQWRAYSLTSVPGGAERRIAVTVKAIPDGKVSNHLVRRVRPGTIVQLDQAQGDFVLPEATPERILFLTAGSGITPVMAMLRAGLPARADVVLVHSAPTRDDVIFGTELRALAARGALRLVERHTETDGLLGVHELDDLVPDHTGRRTWACGPVGLLDAVEAHWAARGVADRLHTERFRPTVISPGDGGTVTFTHAGVTATADGATSLLDVGENAGVLMPSGCRMGICFGCVLPLRQGAVRDLRNGDLTTAVPGDGVLIQTCVSAAAGTCDIEL
ncbi:ferredoxin reductase [Micromonospora narathiwatensis]|uniref:Ferredoxin-NADP reductase n=1 Tax=Micromonospora narathiwatensis TaxID=299146 RepID=A0A1A8ZB95_9ACTN|nr:ferredoxin reductase [Micromonospora narathiwatensis]SBT41245.1 Ferredoxin-NADP reductase [Micromonospora narathiwatensis]